MGLPASLLLVRGARVKITSNIWISVGITNGATGTVKHIIYMVGACPPDLPLAIVVEMNVGYNGPCLNGKPRHVAINM